jgi:ribosomal-protein-alanine N-acetyltransferase
MPPTLHTAHLRLEPLREAHAPQLLAYYERNRAHLQRWEPSRDEAFYTLARQRANIARSGVEASRGTFAGFVAFEPGGSEIVASINLNGIRRGVLHAGLIGYGVDAAYTGRGYATEIAGEVVRYAFEELNLHRVEASYQPENHASARVLQKLGFIVEGYARDYLLLDGAWRDGVLVSRTNDRWRPQA